MKQNWKTIAFYATVLSCILIGVLGAKYSHLLPNGTWVIALMVGLIIASGLLLSSSDDNFRRLQVNRSTPPR